MPVPGSPKWAGRDCNFLNLMAEDCHALQETLS
jgi:hypothetical protein